MRSDTRRKYDEIARALIPKRSERLSLTSPSTGTGTEDGDQDAAWVNPMTGVGDLIAGGESGAPVRLGPGTAGQVLTMQGDGTLAWQAPSGGGGSYRQYVVVSDGAGGFDLIDDGTGHPVMSLEATE